MKLVLPWYLQVTPGLVVTTGYPLVTSGCFLLLLLPYFSNNSLSKVIHQTEKMGACLLSLFLQIL